MKMLDIRDIDFEKLKIVNNVISSESSLYYDDELFYKLFDNFSDVSRKRDKLLLLNDGDNIPNVVIPNILINNGDILYGCAMENIVDSSTIVKYRNTDIYSYLLYNVSVSLKNIHNDPRNIVIGDFHFNNIIIDKNYNHYFIDIDSCKIDGILQDRTPNSLVRYLKNRGYFNTDVCVNTDKLCMFLSIINSLFGKDIDSISMEEYDKKGEELFLLREIRSYILEIKNNSNYSLDIPYLCDVISWDDTRSKIKKLN